MREEIDAIELPHGTMITIPGIYLKKLIMKRCELHQDLYSSRKLLERTIPTVPMPQSAVYAEVKDSIVWYWSLSPEKRADLEARYRGTN